MIHVLLLIIYLAFISLGLPDALLGSAWPMIHLEFDVPVSYAGIIFGIISVGTIISSLSSDYLTKKLGAGKVTAMSVCLTAVALFGFSFSSAYWQLILWAIPYGMGAGSVDACLNNYVALHYKSHHMSWLHCMWGLGASIGPYIMSFVLTNGQIWNMGYRYVGILQILLTTVLFLSLPLWKVTKATVEGKVETPAKVLSLREIFIIPGAKEVMIMFFCYCALEQTTGLWASTYLVLNQGITEETAALFGSLFYIGITVGRFINGFIAFKLNDTQMIRLGFGIIGIGILTMLLPLGNTASLIGLIFIGFGCAPIYPCVIHSTPDHFGSDKSQSIVGVQMACAYIGNLCMPPLFGILANHISVALMPIYLLAILILMLIMHEQLCKKTEY